jgi:hypothetical protein
MPVRKFRHVGEMERELWIDRDDPRLFAAIKSVWDFAQRTVRLRFPPGVYKFQSADDAAEQRERWERRNFEAFQQRRHSAHRS